MSAPSIDSVSRLIHLKTLSQELPHDRENPSRVFPRLSPFSSHRLSLREQQSDLSVFCAWHYGVMKVLALPADNDQISKPRFVGRNRSSWKSSQWDGLRILQELLDDRPECSLAQRRVHRSPPRLTQSTNAIGNHKQGTLRAFIFEIYTLPGPMKGAQGE